MRDLRLLWPHPPKLKVSFGGSIESTYAQTAHHRMHQVFKGRVSCWESRVSASTATEIKYMYSKQKYFSNVSTSANTSVQSAYIQAAFPSFTLPRGVARWCGCAPALVSFWTVAVDS
jgi:hypothetical protein